ncbi:MAG: tol-pal system protein YbgF, partial [Pseudomonadota bacterium]|nr:tol-pal system protein YbgF [Pseudomonadota bacterium]
NLAANLFVALVPVAARAETAIARDARMVRLDAQIVAARNEIHIAQGYGRPPGEIGEPGDVPYAGEQPDGTQQDSAGLLVRIGRLESQMRQISGQIEQMQFETRRLAEQLKKFEEDVDFRFHEGGSQGAPVAKPPQKRSEAPAPQINGDDRGPPQSAASAASRANGRGDAFDPSQNPGAPGAPRPLGSFAPAASTNPAGGRNNESGPAVLDRNDPGAPLDLSNGRSRIAGPPPTTPTPPMAAANVAASGITTPGGTVIAMAPNPAQEEFDIALGYFKQRAYENAEKGFAGFLEKNPKNKMASDAIYYLGESFYQRGRQSEAAKQYLKISTQYANSPRAPEALLRLGQSLNALGAKEQACATYGQIAKKYPNAPATVKTGAEREAKRAQC